MQRKCALSGQEFEISEADLDFYKRMAVPPPTLCPLERSRRRLSFRNEHSLHKRKCDASGREIVSLYRAGVPFPVFDNDLWWQDGWNGLEFGKSFDFTKTFGEQFSELFNIVPKMARIQQGANENSTYTNCAGNNKNCYLLFSGGMNEDCLYCTNIDQCKNCIDCFYIYSCELAYECVDCSHSYDIQFCQQVHGSSHTLRHCYDCRGCQNCFGCVGLRGKSYYVLNEPVSQQVFSALIADPSAWHDTVERFKQLLLRVPRLYTDFVRCENFSGSNLRNCKNAYECWDSDNLEDCKFCASMRGGTKNSYDVDYYGVNGVVELVYECEGVGWNVFNCMFSKLLWGGCSNIICSYECFASHDLVGCCGLKHQNHCILNMQYSQAEYEKLKERIIEHMRQTGEWGEFFPITLSPFGYNETVAHVYFPFTKREALERGYTWYEPADEALASAAVPAGSARLLTDAVFAQIYRCAASNKRFKITPSELEFYRRYNLPLPDCSPDIRHRRRADLHGKRRLFERRCAKTGELLLSPYPPDTAVRIYSEKAYLESVHGMQAQ